MKSRITIDLAENNQPVIKVQFIPSEDVRDKMVQRFLEGFGSSSAWSKVEWKYDPNAPVINNTIEIRPILPLQLQVEAKEMESMYKLFTEHIIEKKTPVV